MANFCGRSCEIKKLDGNRLAVVTAIGSHTWNLSDCEIHKDAQFVKVTSEDGTVELSLAEWRSLEIEVSSSYQLFFTYLLATVAAIYLIILGLRLSAAPIANLISIQTEKKWFSHHFTVDQDLTLFLNKMTTPVEVSIALLDNSSEVNAYALPGAQILVTSQLICFSETPDELIGVIAHELGHIQEHHVMRSMISNLESNLFLMVSGAGWSTNAFATGVANHFSIEDELAADRIALKKMTEMGIPSRELANFFQRLKTSRLSTMVETLMGDHPLTESRIEFFKNPSSNLKFESSKHTNEILVAWTSLRKKSNCK